MRYIINRTCIALALAVCSATLVGCKQDQPSKVEDQLPTSQVVTVMKVEPEKTMATAEVMGTVRTTDSAAISSRISGHITELSVTVGSKVNRGDLLVKIDAADISARLLQAKARLAEVDRNLEREKNLLLKAASTPETVKSLEDTHRITEASVKEAQTMFDYAAIRAPFTGTIAAKNVNVGDLATPGKPLLEIESDSEFQVVANIPESMILKIKIGDIIPISVPAADFADMGQVREISPAADPLSRTTPIKLALPHNPSIRSGQFARLSLPSHSAETIYVPQSAILPWGQMERVFTLVDGMARLRLVRTGALINGQFEILSGLDPGDQVVVTGEHTLTDGQPINTSR